MSKDLENEALSVNPNNLSLSKNTATTISNRSETNPANMDTAVENSDPNKCNSNNSSSSPSNQLNQEQSQRANDSKESCGDIEESIMKENKGDCSNDNNDSLNSEQKNDSSTFSTAFTISFGDEDSASKKLGIKDSIRKFAPPKPHTIEKPRQPKSDGCQDNSLASIESAPADYSKCFVRKQCSNSSRSSSRRSNSSRHSNISESAAFLIDKMLNFKQDDAELDVRQNKNKIKNKSPSSSSSSKVAKKGSSSAGKGNRITHSSDDILDSEIDYAEDKSDNGTYIVGADPESDAARKKMDELFGVVKAAEASVILDSATVSRDLHHHKVPESKFVANSRQSRISDRKPEPVNRTGGNSSRSSSSSRQGNTGFTTTSRQQHQPRASSSHSRNSSCDRTPRINHQASNSRPRRSISQSSRHSSSKELSDGDTRSSRSSLHNDPERATNQDNLLSNLPSMKFNRAFALRRARLGLGEPARGPINQQQNYSQEVDYGHTNNAINSSQRRHQINTNTYKAAGQHQSVGSANFSRDDGGRYSLRMKNSVIPGRLNSANNVPSANRSPQHSALLDSYISKVSGTKVGEQAHPLRNMPKLQQSPLPNQSGDEFEPMSPSRYRLLMRTGRLQKKGPSEIESDYDSYNNRFNYSSPGVGELYDTSSYSMNDSRAGSSTGRKGSVIDLGALDSLVISAISSLSLKIRHSVCDVLVEHAKKLPVDNETRLIVEEILPQLTANSSKSPTSIEEIDQSLCFDLAKTLKNLKKIEQMVDVINLISNQLPPQSSTNFKPSTGTTRTGGSTTTSEVNSNDASPV